MPQMSFFPLSITLGEMCDSGTGGGEGATPQQSMHYMKLITAVILKTKGASDNTSATQCTCMNIHCTVWVSLPFIPASVYVRVYM